MTTLSKLQNIVEFTYHNRHSSWYRKVCLDHGIEHCLQLTAFDDFQQLPVLNRAMLNQFSPFERLSTDMETVDDVRSTSGTSGQEPLFYFRTTAYRHMARRLVQDGARRKIYLWGYQHVITHVENDRIEGLQTVICDPQQLIHHIPLVSAMQADTLAGTPSLLLLFGQMLDTIEDRLRIRFLEFTGEPARPQTLAALKRVFPLAKPYDHYAMGEMGQEMGLRTPSCDRQNTGYFHLSPEGIFAENLNGRLLVTQLNVPTAFPLIRYDTGDQVEWLEKDICNCGHNGISFELSGRANVDFVRIAGVEIRYEEIAAIVDNWGGVFENYVCVEVTERVSGDAQRISLNVIVVPAAGSADPPEKLKEGLKKEICENLRLSATTRLSDMIKAGLFNNPKITLLSEVPINTKAAGIRVLDT